jgi:hypothetical protein
MVEIGLRVPGIVDLSGPPGTDAAGGEAGPEADEGSAVLAPAGGPYGFQPPNIGYSETMVGLPQYGALTTRSFSTQAS